MLFKIFIMGKFSLEILDEIRISVVQLILLFFFEKNVVEVYIVFFRSICFVKG